MKAIILIIQLKIYYNNIKLLPKRCKEPWVDQLVLLKNYLIK